MVLLLQNPAIPLLDAYEQAVWANPVTRAKEQERLRLESEVNLRKEAEEAATAAKRGRGTVIQGRDTPVSSDALGSIEDTMKETLKQINSRT